MTCTCRSHEEGLQWGIKQRPRELRAWSWSKGNSCGNAPRKWPASLALGTALYPGKVVGTDTFTQLSETCLISNTIYWADHICSWCVCFHAKKFQMKSMSDATLKVKIQPLLFRSDMMWYLCNSLILHIFVYFLSYPLCCINVNNTFLIFTHFMYIQNICKSKNTSD